MKMCSRSMLVAIGATLAASVVLAEETQVKDEEAAAATETKVVATEPTPQVTNAVRVVRDKKTGKLRAPNPAELRKMAEMEAEAAQSVSLMPAASDTTITRGADGTSAAMLGTEHLMSLHGERAEDGSIKKSHSEESDDQSKTNEWPTE